MDDIPQEFPGDLLNSIRAGLLRVHSKHIDGLILTECLKEGYDVYAGLLHAAGWPLTETLLTESIPAWLFQWAVRRNWLPYPPQRTRAGGSSHPQQNRRDKPAFVSGKYMSSHEPIPVDELTVAFGAYKVTDWYKADVMKRLGSRIAYWQAEASVSGAGLGALSKPEPPESTDVDKTGAELTQPALESTSTGRKRGPKPDYGTASGVAEIVARIAPDGDWRSKLDDICEALDDEKIPVPTTWRKNRQYECWSDCLERSICIKAIEYRLEMAKHRKKTAPETLA
jgi:hypothetical protein